MSALTSLPNELLHYICVYTQFNQIATSTEHGQPVELDNKSLLQLCRSCRALRDVAQDILYRTVSPRLDKGGSLLPLWRLSETILARPSLAGKVKSLSLQLNPQASIKLSAVEAKLFSKVHPSLSTPRLSHEAAQKIWAYEIVHALVSNLPSVENLHITIVGYDARACQGQVSAKVLDRLRALSHVAADGWPVFQPPASLKSLEIAHQKVQAYTTLMLIGEIELASLLSSLESVCLRRRQTVSTPRVTLPLQSSLTNITNLELRECCINLPSLTYHCGIACGLKRFTYVTLDPLTIHRGLLLGRPELDPGPLVRQPTPSEMLEVLYCQRNTLEYLQLDFYDWYQSGHEALWDHDAIDPKQRYPSFRHFKKLQVLDIEHDRIGPPQELPESLVALTLTHRPNQPCLFDDPLHYPRIERSYKKLILENVCPKLRYVKVGRFYPFRYVGDRLFEWRFISERKWMEFVSCAIDFNDPSYEFEVEGRCKVERDKIQDFWWDQWWQTWLSESWPKGLKEDLIRCLYAEAARAA
ncbi:Nn.00g061480.m01.CDS01 [Neocucurbitaria sp. VM-36]